ncbi:hypothetical protein PTTG_01109 [Puccinia triticina 1-1 BBBD Race 1]|uniref:ECM11 domain-containing protein n=1 Tax=Puccinia triticina (isolate 1-1 / race 1 (BBBD)) TaxID=630390 RepID=A0A0C4EK36_PUCT1|nr:hypothetical protein PTTG_01109 [Puccinia triticina 1-1 BBBD Race 1]
MERSDNNQAINGDQMLPPPVRKSLIPPSPKPSMGRKPSISRQPVPVEFSASPTIRDSRYNPQASTGSPSLSGRRTPSLGGRPAARRGTEESLMIDIFNDHGLVNDQENIKGPRKRSLFGNIERKSKSRLEENSGEKGPKESCYQPPEENVLQGRRFVVQPPHLLSPRSSKKRCDPSGYEKGWPGAERAYNKKEPKLVESKRGSPVFHHSEEQNLDQWFEEQRIDRVAPSNDNREGSSDDFRSSPYYEHIEDTEKTILGPSGASSPELETNKENVAGLTDLDESLKLIPDPGEYRPGAYNSLTDEQWLSAGQKLIERFCDNSQKVQKIITARAQRMASYTTMIDEYHKLLRHRRAELKAERESIQEGVSGSIAGYWKSQHI